MLASERDLPMGKDENDAVRWLIRAREAKGRARERFRVGRVAGSVGNREENLDLAS